MNVFIAGGTGATGSHLVRQLLERGHNVRAVVRSRHRLPKELHDHDQLQITEACLLEMSHKQLEEQVQGCEAVASCLGHNITFKGIYGKPRRLVEEATRRLAEAGMSANPDQPSRFVLMNSSGVRNRDLDEPAGFWHKVVIGLIRALVPPHADNERAAEVLRTEIGQNHQQLQWVAVRPDGLINEDEITPYEAHPSPIRDAIFSAGQVSRINVAHFMAELMTNDELWQKWQGQMPVLYSREE